jgi:hypothetical protein
MCKLLDVKVESTNVLVLEFPCNSPLILSNQYQNIRDL